MVKRNRVITFVPIIALATLFSCITAVKRVANDVENSLGKENDAIQTALMRKRNYSLCDDLRCYVIDHLMHSLLRRIHPGNRDEVFRWQNFKPADFWDRHGANIAIH